MTVGDHLALWITCGGLTEYHDSMAFTFSAAALSWLFDGCGPSLLVLADSLALPRLLAQQGYTACVVHRDLLRLRSGLGTPGLNLAVARAEALPFDDCRFDAVVVHQVFPEVAPGLALPEMARVLRPQGHLIISHLARDNSVPWVRRLAELMRSVDATAMAAPSVEQALAPARRSKYFQRSESRDFRHWEPITRAGMIAMVAQLPAVQILDEMSRHRLLDAVAEIHDQAAGNNELRLPYQLGCWRGQVDQGELTHPIRIDDPGLVISL